MVTDSDSGLISLLFLIDLNAAFDSAIHNIFLQRLNDAVLKETRCTVLSHIHLTSSRDSPLNTDVILGVPHGSVLGPIFFFLLLGMHEKRQFLHFHCCAHDTQFYLSVTPDDRDQLVKLLSGMY